GDRLRTLADDAVRIGEDETRLVRRIGFQIENAPRKHVRRDDVPGALLIDPLAVQTQHGQARLPLRLAGLSIRHPDLCVAVGVAVDRPLEAEVDQGRVVDDELAWLDANLRRGGAWTVAETQEHQGERDGRAGTRADGHGGLVGNRREPSTGDRREIAANGLFSKVGQFATTCRLSAWLGGRYDGILLSPNIGGSHEQSSGGWRDPSGSDSERAGACRVVERPVGTGSTAPRRERVRPRRRLPSPAPAGRRSEIREDRRPQDERHAEGSGGDLPQEP